MLTALAAAVPVADAAGLAAAGGAAGPHAVATPTAASACRNRLRSIFGPASRSIFIPPCGSRARLYLRCDPHQTRAQPGAARASAAAPPRDDVGEGCDRASRRYAG